MSIDKYKIDFEKKKPFYDRLGKNVKQALETFLIEKQISFLAVNYRIKKLDSFLEKIERKNYETPFEEVEDICGIRIICYYQNDINRIEKILKDEFDIIESEDKEVLLNQDQFGYRSFHIIAKIKNNWFEAPNYRGLEDYKIEIQIRTVLMHAWAEIEHKLAYKQKEHVPPHLKRKLSRVSAKLEEADEQFEEIKNSSEEYKAHIIKEAEDKGGKFDPKMILNLDNFQAFLDFNFPNRYKDIDDSRELLNRLNELKITFKEILDSYEKTKDHLPEIERQIFKNFKVRSQRGEWTQTGVMRMILDLNIDRYFKNRDLPEEIKETKKYWTEKLKN